MIKRTDENKKITYFKDLKEVADTIESNQEKWKIQMTIAGAIINRKRAFKSFWNKTK